MALVQTNCSRTRCQVSNSGDKYSFSVSPTPHPHVAGSGRLRGALETVTAQVAASTVTGIVTVPLLPATVASGTAVVAFVELTSLFDGVSQAVRSTAFIVDTSSPLATGQVTAGATTSHAFQTLSQLTYDDPSLADEVVAIVSEGE